MAAAERAAQFPDDMITQGNDLLCKCCWAVVEWEETLHACLYECLFLLISWQHWLHPLGGPSG